MGLKWIGRGKGSRQTDERDDNRTRKALVTDRKSLLKICTKIRDKYGFDAVQVYT